MGGWHHNDLTIAAGAPSLAAWRFPTAYVLGAQGTQHVAYESNGHIHELWWDSNGWHYDDLTIAAGAPNAQWVRDPVGYVFDVQGTQHLVYWADSHIHELWWDNNGWHHNDLTIAAGAPNARGDPVGYVFDAQATQHVIYLGDDLHIHELWWDNNGWHFNDLTIAAGAPDASGSKSWPEAYVAQGTQHVVYRSPDDHVHELWWDNNAWHFNDLTIAAGAPPAGAYTSGNPTGYVFDAQGTQHVSHIGNDDHIRDLWWDYNGWHHEDLTIAAGAPLGFGAPRGYVFDAYGEQHVVYWGEDWGIYDLWWNNNGWHYTDLLVAADAPDDWSSSAPRGYVFEAYGEQHVVYCGQDHHIHELRWNPFRMYELRWLRWDPFRTASIKKRDTGLDKIRAQGKTSDIQRGRNAAFRT